VRCFEKSKPVAAKFMHSSNVFWLVCSLLLTAEAFWLLVYFWECGHHISIHIFVLWNVNCMGHIFTVLMIEWIRDLVTDWIIIYHDARANEMCGSRSWIWRKMLSWFHRTCFASYFRLIVCYCTVRYLFFEHVSSSKFQIIVDFTLH
jgi:hypothetical protein